MYSRKASVKLFLRNAVQACLKWLATGMMDMGHKRAWKLGRPVRGEVIKFVWMRNNEGLVSQRNGAQKIAFKERAQIQTKRGLWKRERSKKRWQEAHLKSCTRELCPERTPMLWSSLLLLISVMDFSNIRITESVLSQTECGYYYRRLKKQTNKSQSLTN